MRSPNMFRYLPALSLLVSLHLGASPLAAITPAPRLVEYKWMSTATWYRHHADDLELSHGPHAAAVELLFIGDSITESWDWDANYRTEFDRHFGDYRTANLGIGGDMTQNVLWRLQHGAVGDFAPQAIVLLIGVNNFGLGQQSPQQAATGVGAVIQQLLSDFPTSQIICMGILPYGETLEHEGRDKVAKANQIISQFESARVAVYDFGHLFIAEDGRIPKELMSDFLHPTAAGMGLLGAQLKPIIKQILAK